MFTWRRIRIGRKKKWAIRQRLRLRPRNTVLLVEDETILRLFPPLRSAWAMRGEQAQVPITGRNARRVLQGALNLDTARRILMRHANHKHANFGAFLSRLRRRYQQRPIWLLLDKDPSHTAGANRRLARRLHIRLIWLPKQCSELNPMDQLWKELKKDMAANRQFRTIDEGADHAENWIQSLSRWQVFQKTGLHSEHCWLRVR
jgi:transposase